MGVNSASFQKDPLSRMSLKYSVVAFAALLSPALAFPQDAPFNCSTHGLQHLSRFLDGHPERVQEIARARSVQFHEASVAVAELHADGQLDESVLQQLVEENNFDGIAAALSLMCDLPLGPVERALAQGYYEQILLFAKATELSWNITLELIRFQASGKQLSQGEMDQYFASYTRMQVKTAKAALQFYRLRASASGT